MTSKSLLLRGAQPILCGEPSCGAKEPPTRCSRCKSEFYCNRECQAKHYDAHRELCFGMFEATRCERCKIVAGILKDSTVVHADQMTPNQEYIGNKSFVLHSPFTGALGKTLLAQTPHKDLPPFDTILIYRGQLRSGLWDVDFSKANLQRMYEKHREPCPICDREIQAGGSYSCLQCMTHVCVSCILRIIKCSDEDGYGVWKCPVCRTDINCKSSFIDKLRRSSHAI